MTAVTDSAIASDALRYAGHVYIYGGAPGKNGTHGWDCSSFANWVIGHDMALPIPGDPSYSGLEHGPPTTAWLVWSGVETISTASVAAGDLLVWESHMGIATDNTHMISALNESLGTRVTTIAEGGPSGEILVPKRLKNTVSGASGTASLTSLTSVLGDLNPATWAAAIEQDVVKNPVEKLWNWFLNGLGVKSVNDLLERGALILLGAILVIMGISSMVQNQTGSPVANVQESKTEGADVAEEESG